MEWREIHNKEVSEYGDVRKKLEDGSYFYYKSSDSRSGHLYVGGRSVQQWVAMAFLGHEPNGNKLVVDHIDGDVRNNHVSNLQIISHGENIFKRNTPKTSIYPFVTFDKARNLYKIVMNAEGKNRTYGAFSKEEDAGKVSRTLCEIYRPEYLKYFDNL